MRDPALDRAIGAAGGVRALARGVGVSQPAISNWKRVPADRVLSVEALTGIARTDLRPDLYPEDAAAHEPIPMNDDRKTAVDDLDEARAGEYELIGSLMWRAPTADTLRVLQGLQGDASPLGLAHLALAEIAREITPEQARDEFFALFIGVGRGEFLPYASYYLTGFLHERPLAIVREDMGKLSIARAERAGEPEDHVAVLMDIMANLIRGSFSAPDIDEAAFFSRHLQPWAARLFADLEMSKTAHFYKAVGRIGSLFVAIETEAASLPA